MPRYKLILVTSLLCISANGRDYTTSFPLTENPISEGGNWANGGTDGLDWLDCKTTGGHVQATAADTGTDDPTAIVKGSWGPDQTVTATILTGGGSEHELRVRTTITAHSITGYEVNWASGNYIEIVRWNGALNNFDVLAHYTTAPVKQDGDIFKMTIVGSLITVFVNGSSITNKTDTTFSSGGGPGIGFFGSSIGAGFTTFNATDGLITQANTNTFGACVLGKMSSQ